MPFPKQALVFTCLQYKSFENTVGKGEIARNEQFLLFPKWLFFLFHMENFRLFTRKSHPREPRWRSIYGAIATLACKDALSQTSPNFYVSAIQVFWKRCGKGEIARNEQFLLFPKWLFFSIPYGELSAIYTKIPSSRAKMAITLRSDRHLGLQRCPFPNKPWFFYVSAIQVFWKHCGKRRNCS